MLHTYIPSPFRNTQVFLFYLQKRARFGFMVGFFKIYHFHRSIAEKAFLLFISLLLTDLNYKITRLSITTAPPSPHGDDDLPNYEATYDLATMLMPAP